MNNKTAIDRIDECGVLIAGYCNAAEIILETALGDLDQMIKTKAIMKAAADTIKNEIESAQFLIYEIHKNADAIDDIITSDEFNNTSDEFNTMLSAKEIREAIGSASLLKAARLAKGYTEEQLSELIGVSPDAVKEYESGQRIPRDEIKVKLADALEKPLQDLFF